MNQWCLTRLAPTRCVVAPGKRPDLQQAVDAWISSIGGLQSAHRIPGINQQRKRRNVPLHRGTVVAPRRYGPVRTMPAVAVLATRFAFFLHFASAAMSSPRQALSARTFCSAFAMAI